MVLVHGQSLSTAGLRVIRNHRALVAFTGEWLLELNTGLLSNHACGRTVPNIQLLRRYGRVFWTGLGSTRIGTEGFPQTLTCNRVIIVA